VLRLSDMGVPAHLLAACLRGVLAQRLVRRLCPPAVVKPGSSRAGAAFRRPGWRRMPAAGSGSRRPAGSAWRGSAAASGLFEYMAAVDPVREAIRAGGAGAARLRALALDHGMLALQDDGLRKVLDGVTSIAEVAAVI